MRGNKIICTCHTVFVTFLLVIFAHVRIPTHVTFVFVTCYLVLVDIHLTDRECCRCIDVDGDQATFSKAAEESPTPPMLIMIRLSPQKRTRPSLLHEDPIRVRSGGRNIIDASPLGSSPSLNRT